MMRYDTFPDENAGLMYNFITSSNLCINIFHTNIIMVACCCYIQLIHMCGGAPPHFMEWLRMFGELLWRGIQTVSL